MSNAEVNLEIFWESTSMVIAALASCEIVHDESVIGNLKKGKKITAALPKICTLKVYDTRTKNVQLIIKLKLEENAVLTLAMSNISSSPMDSFKYPYGRLWALRAVNCQVIEQYYEKNGKRIK